MEKIFEQINRITVITFFIIICSLCSYGSTNDHVVIEGDILRMAGKGGYVKAHVARDYAYPWWTSFTTVHSSEVDSNGSFTLSFPLGAQFGYVALVLESREGTILPLTDASPSIIYYLMETGDRIKMKTRGSMVIFAGTGATKMEAQTVIADLGNLPVGSMEPLGKMLQRGHAEEFVTSYGKLIENHLAIKLSLLDAYQDILSDTVYRLIRYSCIGDSYSAMYQFMAGAGNNKGYEFLSFRDALMAWKERILETNDPLAGLSPFYTRYLYHKEKSRLIYFGKEESAFSDFMFDDLYWQIMQRPRGLLRDAVFLNAFMNEVNIRPDVRSYAELIADVTTASDIRGLLEDWFVQNAESQPAYPFALPDTSGIIHRLEDFSGYILVVDFWFNGCFGCIGMNSALRPIIDRFSQDNRVKFVSIAVDRTREDWLVGLASGQYSQPEQLKLSTYGTSWIENPFFKHYNYNSLPQLLVIDGQGKVISASPPDPRKDGGKGLGDMIYKALK